MIVVNDSLFENYHELVDTVHKMSHSLSVNQSIGVGEAHKIDELSSDVEEHAVRVVEMLLQHH